MELYASYYFTRAIQPYQIPTYLARALQTLPEPYNPYPILVNLHHGFKAVHVVTVVTSVA